MTSTRSSHPIRDFIAQLLALPAVAQLFVPACLWGQAAPVVVAPDSGHTKTYTTIGGTAVVDIDTPNAAGLSHNRYINFNVPATGLVLNNAGPAQFTATSQLAGELVANFNLKPGVGATVILNEVVAPNISRLEGFTEVVGAAADVVVANPYGITVNGAGFLNTTRVTLAAGSPVRAGDGGLAAINLGNGQLLVTGTGIDGSNLDYLTLLGRSVRLDGQVNAKDLTVGSGVGAYDYVDGTLDPDATEAAEAPEYAIDSTLLGGMYANRIRLIANEAGVGVRLLGEAAATADDFSINADGQVELAGRVYAERDLSISGAGGVAVTGAAASLTSQRNLSLDAGAEAMRLGGGNIVSGGNLSLTGGTLDDAGNDAANADRFAINGLSLDFAGAATIAGANYGAGEATTVTAGALTLANQAVLYSGANAAAANRSLRVATTTGGMTLGDAQLASPGGLTLVSAGDISLAAEGLAQADGDLNATAGGAVVLAEDATFTGTNLSITAASLDNAGSVYSKANLSAVFSGTVNNAGSIVALNTEQGGTNGSLTLVGRGVSNANLIQATGALNLEVGSRLDNAADGIVLAGSSLALTSGTGAFDVTNSGRIQIADSFSLGGAAEPVSLRQTAGGVLLTGGDLTVTGTMLENAGIVQASGRVAIDLDQDLVNSAGGTLLNAGPTTSAMFLSAANLTNAGQVQSTGSLALTADGRVENAATGVLLTLAAAAGGGDGDVSLTAEQIVNAGTLQSAGSADLRLTGANPSLVNSGTVAVADALTLAVGNRFDNTLSGVVSAGTDMAVTSGTGAEFALANEGNIGAGAAMVLGSAAERVNYTGGAASVALAGTSLNVAGGDVINAGSVQAGTGMTIGLTRDLTNSGSMATTGADANVSLAAANLTNSGTVAANGALTAVVGNAFLNTGEVQSQSTLAVDVGRSFTNHGAILSGAALDVKSSVGGFDLTNTGRIQSTGTTTIGSTGAEARVENAAPGVITAGGESFWRTSSVLNAGAMQATGYFNLISSGDVTNQASGRWLTTAGSMAFEAANLFNYGTIQSAGAFAGTVGGDVINTGLITALGTDVTLQAARFDNSGIISAADALRLTATRAGAPSVLNTGSFLAGTDMAIMAPGALVNSAGALIYAGRDASVQGGGAFTFTNSGNVEIGRHLTLGSASGLVELINTSSGVVRVGQDLTVASSTATNDGIVFADGNLKLSATGALTNTGKFNGRAVDLTTGSLNNSGQMASFSTLLATSASTIENSGEIQAGSNLTLTTKDSITNQSAGLITAGGFAKLQSSGGLFTVLNKGRIQAGDDLSIGNLAGRANFENTADASVVSGADLDIVAGTLSNTGLLQGKDSVTVDASGAMTNASAGNVVTTAATGGGITIEAASLTNQGTIQSANQITGTIVGALNNSGVIATLGTSAGGAAGNLKATAATFTNSGTVASAAQLDVTTNGTTSPTFTNSGTLQAVTAANLTTAKGLSNTAAGKILAGGAMAVQSGGGTFTFDNDGSVQAGGTLTIGTVAAGVTLDNAATGLISAGDDLTIAGAAVTNLGTVQSSDLLDLDLTGALTNAATGKILSTGALTVDAASASNAGNIESQASLAVTLSGDLSNSSTGTLLTAGTDTLAINVSKFTNDGRVQASAVLDVDTTFAGGDSLINHGTVTSAGAATFTARGGVQNSSTGKIHGDTTLLIENGSTGGAVISAVNAGQITANQAITLGSSTHRFAVTNSASGVVSSEGTLAIHGSDVTNQGALQSDGALTVNATGALDNQSGATVLTAGDSSAAVTLTANTLTNAGTLQSSGDLTGTITQATTNTGLIATAGTGAFTLSTSALTNNATMQSGGTLQVTTTGSGTTISNTGKVLAADALTLTSSGAVNNTATGQIATTGSTPASLTVTTTDLTNAGVLQSTGALGVTATGAIDNSGTILSQGTGAVTLTAGTSLANTATIQSAGTMALTAGTSLSNTGSGVIKSGDDATLKVGTKLENLGNASIDSGADLSLIGTAAFEVVNQNVIQSSGDMTLGELSRRVDLDSQTGAKIIAGGDLTGFEETFVVKSLIQSGGAMEWTVGNSSTATIESTGKLLSGGDLKIDTSSGGFTLNLSGLVQSGGLLTLGAAGRKVVLDLLTTDAKLFAETFAITAGAITNRGLILGAEGGTITADSFLNSGANARFIGASGEGAMTVTVSGAFTNEGAAHSGGEFNITAATISNTSTGGISSLENLKLTTTGQDISNAGALYAGEALTLTSARHIYNRSTGTIDTGGNFTATATTFENNNEIEIGGTGTITATNFYNAVHETLDLHRDTVTPSRLYDNITLVGSESYDPVPNQSQTNWYVYDRDWEDGGTWDDHNYLEVYGFYFRTEILRHADNSVFDLSILDDRPRPSIAANALTIQGFDEAKNIAGNISVTNTLNVVGSGSGSSFVNDALSLQTDRYNYHVQFRFNDSTNNSDAYNFRVHPESYRNTSSDFVSSESYFTVGSGIRAGTINVSNVGTLTNKGSPTNASPDATSVTGASADTLATSSTVNGASAAGTTGGTLSSGNSVAGVGTVTRASGASAVSATSLTHRDGASLRGADGVVRGSARTATAFGTQSAVSGANFAGISSVTLAGGSLANRKLGEALISGRISIGGLSINLPSNPNGFFVTTPDPTAKFVVSVNDTFGIDSDAVGSDFLAEQLGFDADQIERRLGDPSYETYLVRKQLTEQTGDRLLAGYANEAAQMEGLMSAAAQAARQVGLVWGQAPTASQLAALDTDIVWMVSQVVDGVQVLVPQVYLAPSSKAMFAAGDANFAGGTVSLDVGDLVNEGGNISGSDSLSINASGDVKNLSGSISGGNVAIKAEGSIINETMLSRDGGSSGALNTASITSTGDMSLDAGQDIKVLGADITAGGNASLAAGNEIVVDTVVEESTQFSKENGVATTTKASTNVRSGINVGGNLALTSGGDTTLAGADVNVGGNLDADVGGSLNVLDRQDVLTVETSSSQTGIGVGGGLFGSKTTTTVDTTKTSVGTVLKVGGNANLKAAEDMTFVGADVTVGGDATMDATNINVLEGRNERTVTTTVTTSTIGIYTDSGASATAGETAGYVPGSTGQSGKAAAKASGDLTIGARTEVDTTVDHTSTAVGTKFNIGGNLAMNAKEDILARGAEIEAGGNVDLAATNMIFEEARDVHTQTRTIDTTTTGISFTGTASASAEGEGNASALGAAGSGQAEAEAEVGVGLKRQNDFSRATQSQTTAVVTTIKSGGDLNRDATGEIRDVGTDITVAGNLTQSAETITSLAAQDTYSSSTYDTSETFRVGLYADAKGSADASANSGGSAQGSASGSVSAGVRASYTNTMDASAESGTRAVVSNIKVGGSVSSTSSGKTELEGTNISAGQDITLQADSLDYRAAEDTHTSSADASKINVVAKFGIGASGSASGSSGAGGSGSGGGGLGGSVGVDGLTSGESARDTTAVVGSMNALGNITIKTTNDTRLEGTVVNSGNDTTIDAGGNVTIDAARNTSTSSNSKLSGEAELNLGKGSVGLEGEVDYASGSSNSSTAVTGSFTAGNQLTIKSGGDTKVEGADITAASASVSAGGDVSFVQATSTSDSSSFKAGAELSLSASKSDSGSEKGASFGAEVAGNQSSSSTAKTSNINVTGPLSISSGSDVTLQGTNVNAGGAVAINAAGDLNLTAKEESSSQAGFSVEGSISGSSSSSSGSQSGASFGAGAGFQNTSTQTGGTINAGSVSLSSGSNTTMVGTQVNASGAVNVQAGGTVTTEAARSSSVGATAGFAVAGSSSNSGGGKSSSGAGGAITDLGANASASSQNVSLNSGRGTVNVQSNVTPAPAPASPAPAPTRAPTNNETQPPAVGAAPAPNPPATPATPKPASE